MADWARAATTLADLGYTGPICLCAEYSDPVDLADAVRTDLAYAQGLWATAR